MENREENREELGRKVAAHAGGERRKRGRIGSGYRVAMKDW